MQGYPPRPMTPFDEIVTTQQLQIMKLLLPYFPSGFQKSFAFYIKFTELKNALQHFSHISNHFSSKSISEPFEMLEELRPYMNTQDCDSLDSILSMLNMIEMMKTMDLDIDSDIFFKKGNDDNESN